MLKQQKALEYGFRKKHDFQRKQDALEGRNHESRMKQLAMQSAVAVGPAMPAVGYLAARLIEH